MKKRIADFLKEINKVLPGFMNVKPYEQSQHADFEITIENNQYLSRAAFELNEDFVLLVKKIGGEYFTETPSFNHNKSCFWFG